ncbi:MAG: hypothetical protein M1818_000905 [Claussenomyces sp. TS43310]|nr:MAG: hypothetical protein M1818_000905 [Claussenomyces sp. TS43310]
MLASSPIGGASPSKDVSPQPNQGAEAHVEARGTEVAENTVRDNSNDFGGLPDREGFAARGGSPTEGATEATYDAFAPTSSSDEVHEHQDFRDLSRPTPYRDTHKRRQSYHSGSANNRGSNRTRSARVHFGNRPDVTEEDWDYSDGAMEVEEENTPSRTYFEPVRQEPRDFVHSFAAPYDRGDVGPPRPLPFAQARGILKRPHSSMDSRNNGESRYVRTKPTTKSRDFYDEPNGDDDDAGDTDEVDEDVFGNNLFIDDVEDTDNAEDGSYQGSRRGSRAPPKSMRDPAARTEPYEFSAPNVFRLPARDSGAEITPQYNKMPKKISSDSIADALRMEQGLTRTGLPAPAKRAHGPNDPENILIINMVENQGWTWKAIAEYLNEKRIKTGRKPDFTPNSVHNRYNRNAPILFAAEGKEYVPIKERKKNFIPKAVWSSALDQTLVDVVREVEENKWFTIAQTFNRRTGQNIDAKAAAFRHGLI